MYDHCPDGQAEGQVADIDVVRRIADSPAYERIASALVGA